MVIPLGLIYTQALVADSRAVLPNAEAFCLRGSSRLRQGKALEALDDCYRALSLVSLEVGVVVCARGIVLGWGAG